MSSKRVIIIGGGASGAILAAHLLRQPGVQVTIVEQRAEIGRGLAYSTTDRDHILNTRAGSMSAYADDTDHFWRWLVHSAAASDLECSDPFCFVSRAHYGAYLTDILKPWTQSGGDGRLEIVQGQCTGLRTTAAGVAVDIKDGQGYLGQVGVLATGHSLPGYAAGSTYVSAWTTPDGPGIGKNDPVLILGTGLSMVDAVIKLTNEGHSGKITALSRRGLLPRVHRRNTPLKIDAADVPFGTDISYLLGWFRRTAAWATENGGDWRDVVDGIRPHTARLWQSLTPAARQRFLRHARTWWEVHRHRLPPQSDARMRAAKALGHLDIVTGRFVGMTTGVAGVIVRYRRKGSSGIDTLTVAKVIDCTGILNDPGADKSCLMASLIDSGIVRPDPLKIGIEVTERCCVIDRGGRASTRLFAIGPVTRARFWEITAVPDIRAQSAIVARHICEKLDIDAGRSIEAPARL